MENKKTLHERMNEFISLCYTNSKQFSEICEIDYTSLRKHINGTHIPKADILLKLYFTGLNICWLLSGEGSMFASNEKGTELRMKLEKTHPDYGIQLMKSRINKWIVDNYSSLENFAKEMTVNLDDVEQEIKDYFSSSPIFLSLIENAGCNIDWTVTGKGNVYSNNPRGFIFQYKKEGKKIPEDGSINENIEPHLKVFYELIRKAVRDELKKSKKEKNE